MRTWWALIVEERLGRLVIMQSLSRLNTPRSLLQRCVTWLFTSSDTNPGLSWQLVISRYQTITPGSTDERDSSWAGAGVEASPAERCPGSPQAAGHPERGCWLVCPNQSSSPCVHSPAQNLPVHGCYSPVSELWECSWNPKKPKKLAWGKVDDAGYREVGSPSNSPRRSYGQVRVEEPLLFPMVLLPEAEDPASGQSRDLQVVPTPCRLCGLPSQSSSITTFLEDFVEKRLYP